MCDGSTKTSKLTRSFVQVSNICDRGYLGIQKTLEVLGCHLSPTAINPHATLITLFINAVKEIQKRLGEDGLDLEGLSKFLPHLSVESMLNTQSPEMTRYWDARDMVVDVDHYFRRCVKRDKKRFMTDVGSYMTALRFDEASKFMRNKGQNTIVEAWPTRSSLSSLSSFATPTSIDAFRLILASEWTTLERYVEWKLITPG